MQEHFRSPHGEAFSHITRVNKRDIIQDGTPDIEQELLGHESGLEQKYEQGIPYEHVRAYAKRIAEIYTQHSKGREGHRLIIDALSPESLVEQVVGNEEYRVYLNELTLEEVQCAADRLRKAVIYELGFFLDADDYAFVVQKIKLPWQRGGSTIEAVQDPKNRVRILRHVSHERPVQPETVEAFRRFAELPPHPCLLPIREFGNAGRAMIVDKLSLVTLNDVLKGRPDVHGYQTSELLDVFRGCASALAYLEQHGLMLQDICPANIGISRKTHQGMLFDLDGLFPLGVDTTKRIAKVRYLPPELLQRGRPPITNAKESVYQLGTVLESLRGKGIFQSKTRAQDFPMDEQLLSSELFNLSYDMNQPDPDQRTSLAEVTSKLEPLVAAMRRIEQQTMGDGEGNSGEYQVAV